jgi:Zn-dependent protease
MDTVLNIAVLVMSVVIHEVSHGYAARYMGDRTAEYAGRLTLNPVPHIDILGSLIVPGFLVLTGAGFIIGWAKPVPVNPYNLRNPRWGEAFVAAAGPLSNIALAIIFGLAIRFGLVSETVLPIVAFIVLLNLVLAVFNLMPVPPMDGSKILFAFLPDRFLHWRESLERFGLFLVLFFIIFLWRFIFPVILWLFRLITG